MEGMQWLVNVILGIAMALFGWIANDMKRRLEMLEDANEANGQSVAVLKSEQMNNSQRLERMEGKIDRLLERRQGQREPNS